MAEGGVCSWRYPSKETGVLPKYLITQSTQYLITCSEPRGINRGFLTEIQFVDWFAIRKYSLLFKTDVFNMTI